MPYMDCKGVMMCAMTFIFVMPGNIHFAPKILLNEICFINISNLKSF